MRSNGGYEVIKKAIKKLGMRHREHIAAYGDGNERRLTGHHETADINNFVWVGQDRSSHSSLVKNFSLNRYQKKNFEPHYVTLYS